MPDVQNNRANPSKQAEVIYQSAPSEPDDEFWLEQANKLIVESLPAVRTAAASLMTGLGALQGIYLGMLGFAKFVPDTAALWMKALFLAPLLCWLMGLYQCLNVAKTEEMRIYRHSPADIRQKLGELAREKQRELDLAFYCVPSAARREFSPELSYPPLRYRIPITGGNDGPHNSC